MIRIDRRLVGVQLKLIGRTQAISKRLECVVDTVCRAQDKRPGRTFDLGRLTVFRRNLLSETFYVPQHGVVRSAARVEHVSVANR